MKYTVVMTPQASHELEGMADWWAENRFREQAGRWYTGISDEIDRLSENPQRWALSKESDDFPFELRELHFGLGRRPTHRALFTIAEEFVVILTIRHTARDSLTRDDIEYEP
ncbi:MAG: type II toxin-antitoxin system RelE/ParE family toxin [Planctomycetaceae bacterium]